MARLLVGILVFVVDILYRDRPYPRFYVLETVARVPYFSCLSVLHLYETMGWWRKADWLKVHFAESWNELHHLLIMEELGGDANWSDRIAAKLGAFIYYWILVLVYMVDAKWVYHFMQMVEEHAYKTYDTFLHENEATLKATPAPNVAVSYYRDGDLYRFDEVQMETASTSQRPQIENLYDVFVNIRNDETEHIKTMVAFQDAKAQQAVASPHLQ